MADAENIVATMGLRPDWPNLGVISLAHSYGFSNLVLPLLLHGMPLILAPAPLPEIIRRAAETESNLTLPAVPAMWRVARGRSDHAQCAAGDFRHGAPLPGSLEQEVFRAHGLKIHNFLGSSECGGIAYDASASPRTEAALVGSPMQNVNLSLNDDGCLVVRSRAVAETYWPEKSNSLGDGMFETSDLAEIERRLNFSARLIVWATKSTWPDGKCRRKPLSAHCSCIRRCASVSFTVRRAATRSGRKSSLRSLSQGQGNPN